MPEPLPEMIELLINKEKRSSGRGFITVMDQFVQRIPIIHAPIYPEFFIGYFLGGIYNFQYTPLKVELGVAASFWKYDDNNKRLDLVFKINDQNNNPSHLLFRSITILRSKDSASAIKSTDELPYKDLVFEDTLFAELAYKRPDHKGGLQFKKMHVQPQSTQPSNGDSVEKMEDKLTKLGFEKIQLESNVQNIDETYIEKLSSDEVTVKEALKAYLTGNVDLFTAAKDIFFTKIGASIQTEAFSHGFLYGSLSLNFKNRYRLDVYVERVAGAGYADLAMISRANDHHSDAVPVIIELKAGKATAKQAKAGKVTAKQAIEQIKEVGYCQHRLSLRTYHAKAIIAGVNYNLAEVEVDEVSIISKNNIIAHLVKACLDNKSTPSIQQEIRENLMSLYSSRLGGLDFRSLLAQLVGHLLSFDALNEFKDISKYLFLPSETNNKVNQQEALLAIECKYQGDKKTVIFALSVERGAKTRSRSRVDSDSAITTAINVWLKEHPKNQRQVQKILIRIDPSKTATDFIASIDLETIELPPFSDVMTIPDPKKELHELKTLRLTDFFTLESANLKESIFSSDLEKNLPAALFPLQRLFQGSLDQQQKEFAFQAVMQGISAGFNQGTSQVSSFAEPNHSAQGRADLVVAVAKFNEQKKLLSESLFIFEFKALISGNQLLSNAELARQQAERYVENAKSFTDAKEAAVMGLVMNSHAKSETDFLAANSAIAIVDHSSADEQMSSPKRPFTKRKHPDRDNNPARRPAKRRCRRSVGILCQLDFNEQGSEELLLDLADARKQGHVILLADRYALLLSLLKVENPVGKIVILQESIEDLNRVAAIAALASQAETLEIWLEEVQHIFPKVANSLALGVEKLADRIDFAQFKVMLALRQLCWVKMQPFSMPPANLDSFRQHLGIADEKIAAIYLGDYEYRSFGSEDYSAASSVLKRAAFKEQILSLVSPDESIDLYRSTSPNQRRITLYSGLKSYLETQWQLAGSVFLPVDRQAEALLSLKIVQEWAYATEATEGLNRAWIPILATAQEAMLGKEQMHFINPKTHDVHTVTLHGLSSNILREDLNLLYERIVASVPAETAMSESFSDPIESAESIDGLNAAFTVQAVFDFIKQKYRTQSQPEAGTLYTAIQIHHYLNLAQMAHGSVMDVNKVVDMVKTLLREEILLTEKPLSALHFALKQGASEGLGVLLGAASIILDSVELSSAKTEAEIATFTTQLAFDSTGLSLSVAGMGAAYAGASAAAAVLGASSVILSGLGIGIGALVEAFNQVTQKAVAVGVYFFQLNEAYQRRGYEQKVFSVRNQSMMNPLYGAVVSEINFLNQTIGYGSPYIYSDFHSGVGSGAINYLLWMGTTPRVIRDKKSAINIRERLAYAEKSELGGWQDVLIWILPATPITYVDYNWMILPGATTRGDRGFSVLRKLEQQGDFDYDFYVFPSEFIINTIREERLATQIKIILDEKERTFIVPSFSEQDSDIYKNLHYQIQAPTRAGRCSIILNRVGSLTLNSQHPQYTWVLIAENLGVDSVKFTATGIEIGNIRLVLTSPDIGKYTFINNQRLVFNIDWQAKKLLLIEINHHSFSNDMLGLKSYLQAQPLSATVLINDFRLKDHQGVTYNGRAYYLAKEGAYIYTMGIPEPINRNSDLIECVAEDCYFASSSDLLWRSHRQTHQLQEKYLLYSYRLGPFARNKSDTLDGKGQIESAAVQMDGSVRILQVFKDKQGKIIQTASYHLVQGNLVLSAIADDQLAKILTGIEDQTKLITYLDNIFNQKPNRSSLWDDYPQILAKTISAKIDSIVAIASLSESPTPNSVWFRRKAKGRYQLINPRVAEKQLRLLGSLLADDRSDVFYFLCAAQAGVPAQLFRQSEQTAVAEPVDLLITHAYYTQGMLFILTPEGIIKKLDVFGQTSIVSFNAEWTAQHRDDCWEKIPALLVAENHSAKEAIAFYGLSDLSGNALAAWYEPQQRAFVLMPTPQANGESFQVNYIGHLAGADYFFASNGKLYQQQSISDSMPAYFQAARLQKALPALVLLADSLQAAYFQAQRLYLHQEGLIFSLDPRLPKIWCLEKIKKLWFKDKFSLNHKSRFLQDMQLELMRNYSSDFFLANDPFISIDFSNTSVPFVSTRKDALIAIELTEDKNLWWNPHQNTFFYNPFQLDSADWRYLGVCSGRNDAQGICFFSPKAKMIYFNPDYHADQVNYLSSYLPQLKFPAELAATDRTVFLLVLNISSTTAEYFIPLLRDQKNLNLCISSANVNFFEVSKQVINHYQVSFSQFAGFAIKNLNFLLEEQVQYQQNGPDIRLSSPSVSGQWTFLQGMLDETWNETTLYVSYDKGSKIQPFVFNRLREYLFDQGEASFVLAGDPIIYAHQERHRHAVELSNFSETSIAALSKTQPLSAGLISSSLAVFFGVLASGVAAIFIRRFRQTRSATLAERGLASAVSLLPLLNKLPVAEANSVVDCHRQDFFTPQQCVQNQSSLGVLGYCDNGQVALLWFKNTNTSTAEPFWYALAHQRATSTLNAGLNWQATRINIDSDYLYVDAPQACRQTIALNVIKPIPMSVMFHYLPNAAKQWLQSKWAHEKIIQQQALQAASAHSMVKRLALQITWNYLAGECLLHTAVGDYFQHLGLKVNWQAHDHRYYLARSLSAGQQMLLGDALPSHRISAMAAVGLETALLHPKLQALYFPLCSNPRYAKQAIRFLADVLQFGGYHYAILPSVLELLFSDYAPIHSITLGLRALLSLFSISHDPGYYYLGIAVFFLPQLPLLLEHLGIPVTRYVSQTLEKLSQFFILQSLMAQFTPIPDAERLAERERAQTAAEQRVVQGRQRLSRVVQPVVGFFKPNTWQDADAQPTHRTFAMSI